VIFRVNKLIYQRVYPWRESKPTFPSQRGCPPVINRCPFWMMRRQAKRGHSTNTPWDIWHFTACTCVYFCAVRVYYGDTWWLMRTHQWDPHLCVPLQNPIIIFSSFSHHFLIIFSMTLSFWVTPSLWQSDISNLEWSAYFNITGFRAGEPTPHIPMPWPRLGTTPLWRCSRRHGDRSPLNRYYVL